MKTLRRGIAVGVLEGPMYAVGMLSCTIVTHTHSITCLFTYLVSESTRILIRINLNKQ